MSKTLHIVPGLDDVANGMVVVAKLLAKEQGDAEVVDLKNADSDKIATVDEVWVHGMWLPKEWAVCREALRTGKRLVRMTHGSLSPIYLTQQSPLKKKLISPIERYFLRRADKVVATCEAEKGWIESYLGRRCPPIELTDIKRFFKLEKSWSNELELESGKISRVEHVDRVEIGELHLLYLGRRHPLKGVEYLEEAVAELNSNPVNPVNPVQNSSLHVSTRSTRLKIVSSAFGDELEKVWNWCDILVLPTLSENFGLVIAEALERGKRVITTDGAPAWGENLSRVEGESWSNELELERGRVSRVEHVDRVDVSRKERKERKDDSRVERVDGGMWSGYGGRLIYLKGYREGTKEQRVELLRRAIELMSVGEMMAVS